MLGLGEYGSDSDSDTDDVQAPPPPTTTGVKSQSLSQSSRPASSSSLVLPPPRTKKKIAIALPSLKSLKDDDDHGEDQERPAKKQRLESGAGMSSLLSMLPAPKQKNPVPAAPARVLGGGVGNQTLVAGPAPYQESETVDATPSTSLPFLPMSLAKGKSNISLEDERPKKAAPRPPPNAAPAVDFFSLGECISTLNDVHLIDYMHTGSASTTSASLPTLPKPSTSSSSSSVNISSAPALPTFQPPEPTTTDEYPGYYQLPSGQWAAHDPAYYNTFAKKWQREYDSQVRALEKGAGKGFENLESSDVADVDAAKEMERAKIEIKEREDRKKLSMGIDGEPAKPKMNINVCYCPYLHFHT